MKQLVSDFWLGHLAERSPEIYGSVLCIPPDVISLLIGLILSEKMYVINYEI